jgi:hypothetical protein
MNLAGITKRIETLEEERNAAKKKPWIAIRRIFEDGKLTSERTYRDGRLISGHIGGYKGPVDCVINRHIITPIVPIRALSTAKN